MRWSGAWPAVNWIPAGLGGAEYIYLPDLLAAEEAIAARLAAPGGAGSGRPRFTWTGISKPWN